MKKTITLAAAISVLAVAISIANASVDFDGGGTSQISFKELMASITSIQPTTAETGALSGIAKVSTPQSYSISFYSENEASKALPEIVRKFEAANCVILTSRVAKFVDAGGDIHWYAALSYLAPAALTTQDYSDEFYNYDEAARALPGIVRKFEAAGCVILKSEVGRGFDAASDIHWYASLSYLTTTELKAQRYSESFFNEYEAVQALPGLVKKFEAAGYVVVTSSVSRNSDAAGDIHWYAGFSYFLPTK